MPLTTVGNVKEYMGIPSSITTWDSAISTLIPRCDAAIKARYEQLIERSTIASEYPPSNGILFNAMGVLRLRQLPVYSIENLWQDPGGYFGKGTNAFASSTLLTHGKDYVLDYDGQDADGTVYSLSGLVIRISRLVSPEITPWAKPEAFGWQPGIGNIKVAYTAGWKVLPDWIVHGSTMLVAHYITRVQQMARGGLDATITSERLGDYSVNYAQVMSGPWPEPVTLTLNPLRRSFVA